MATLLPIWECNPNADYSHAVDNPKIFEFLSDVRKKRDGGEIAFAMQAKGMGDGQTWQLEIYKVSNGKKVYAREVEGATFQLNTFDWESGTYVIRAIVRIREQDSSSNLNMITTKVRL